MYTPLSDAQILNNVTQQFTTAITGSTHTFFIAAQALLSGLVVLQIAWSAFKVTIKSDKVEDLQSEILWQIILVGIFSFIAINASWLIPNILNIFRQIATTAEPISALDPASVAAQGITIAAGMFNNFGVIGFLDNLPAGIILIIGAVGIVIFFGLIAIDLMITIILIYFQIALAPLFIAFGAFEYVRGISHSYIKSTLSLGIKLFMLYLVIGVGQSLAINWSSYAQQGAQNKDIMPILAILVSALAFWRISQVLPSHFASIIHSSHVSTGGTGAAMVGGAIAGAATTASLTTGGLGMAASAGGAAIRTSAAAAKIGTMTADHMKSGSSFASATMKAFSSVAKTGVSTMMNGTMQNSSFLKNLDSARDRVRPPQPSQPSAAASTQSNKSSSAAPSKNSP